MKNTRRMKRMARNHKKGIPGMNLTSLMDVFTILVFFLLVNSGSSEVLEPPKQITLPDSVVETKPRETVVILVTPDFVIVQGEQVVAMSEVIASKEIVIALREKLMEIKGNVIGTSTKAISESSEVTILAHKTIPFKILKKIMSSSTYAGYEKISMAVLQKGKQS
ncbi:MAG: biopolymer transporter ExbD [Gammaproteobacteria bacterium]|nr:biopolymer transporter ExbD [Gammaproteobacteria bacterium]MDH5800498.1 biopolymer transporter ExbD [Gammaproteobacteria bacterium]